MYGYVRLDKSTLPCAETQLYYAHFCGLCKTSGAKYGQMSRFCVSYDMAFLDIFMRGLCGVPAQISMEKCILSPKKRRAKTAKTEVSELVSDAGILLSYYKLTDDILDGGGFKRRLFRRGIVRPYRKAKRAHLALEAQIKGSYEQLRLCEQSNERVLDAVCHHFGNLLEAVAVYILKTQKEKNLSAEEVKNAGGLFYNLGKWIYIMDALDDLEADKKSGNYNPLKYEENLSAAEFALGCAAAKTAELYKLLNITVNTEILNNIICNGLFRRAEKLLKGDADK